MNKTKDIVFLVVVAIVGFVVYHNQQKRKAELYKYWNSWRPKFVEKGFTNEDIGNIIRCAREKRLGIEFTPENIVKYDGRFTWKEVEDFLWESIPAEFANPFDPVFSGRKVRCFHGFGIDYTVAEQYYEERILEERKLRSPFWISMDLHDKKKEKILNTLPNIMRTVRVALSFHI